MFPDHNRLLEQLFQNSIMSIGTIVAALCIVFALGSVVIWFFMGLYEAIQWFRLPRVMAKEEAYIKRLLRSRFDAEPFCSDFHQVTLNEIDNLDFNNLTPITVKGQEIYIPAEAWNLMRLWTASRIPAMREILYKYDEEFDLPTHARLLRLFSHFPIRLLGEKSNVLDHNELSMHTIDRFGEFLLLFISYRRHQLKMISFSQAATASPAR